MPRKKESILKLNQLSPQQMLFRLEEMIKLNIKSFNPQKQALLATEALVQYLGTKTDSNKVPLK